MSTTAPVQGAPPPAQAPPVTAEAPTQRRRWLPQGNPVKTAIYLVLLLGVSVIFVYPFLWAVSASLNGARLTRCALRAFAPNVGCRS